MTEFYGEQHRALQDEFASRPLADRLEKLIIKTSMDEEVKAFVRGRDLVMLSTVDQQGFPTVSHKGGDVGFVKVVDDRTLLVPCYDGNGMWLTTGNVAGQSKLGLLFIDLENPHRVRMQGFGQLRRDESVLELWPEVALAIEVKVEKLWINCPRYIHRYTRLESSAHVPREGHVTQPADWKSHEAIGDVVPPLPHEVDSS